MDGEFVDLNDLSIEELDEIIHLQKSLSLTCSEALAIWRKENPNRVKSLGMKKDGEYISHEITEDGVKELSGADALLDMVKKVLDKKDEDKSK